MRTAIPKPFLAYYPALYPQAKLKENVTLLPTDSSTTPTTKSAGHPPQYEALESRSSYDSEGSLSTFSGSATRRVRLGDFALARSGDKGANLNCGIFVKDAHMWDWFRIYLSRERILQLLQDEWDPEFFLERVEFPKIQAVHFVIYGMLGRGVSGSTLLDCLGKGFADYFRDKVVEVPSVLFNESSKI